MVSNNSSTLPQIMAKHQSHQSQQSERLQPISSPTTIMKRKLAKKMTLDDSQSSGKSIPSKFIRHNGTLKVIREKSLEGSVHDIPLKAGGEDGENEEEEGVSI